MNLLDMSLCGQPMPEEPKAISFLTQKTWSIEI